MYTLDAHHHPSRLTAIYNRVGNWHQTLERLQWIFASFFESYCFGETCHAYRRGFKTNVFQLSDLAKMYSSLLQQLWGHVRGRVKSTREITLGFSADIGAALFTLYPKSWLWHWGHASCQSGSACQKRATVFYKKQCFNGPFDTDCQRPGEPHLLLALEQLIL